MPERDARGRFVKGNQAARLSPRNGASAYRLITASNVPLDEWQHVVAKALEDARAGDMHARRWLSDYIMGRPATPPVVAGIETPLIERVIEALRAAEYDPSDVMDTILQSLSRQQEAR